MGNRLRLATILCAFWWIPAQADEPASQETVQSDI